MVCLSDPCAFWGNLIEACQKNNGLVKMLHIWSKGLESSTESDSLGMMWMWIYGLYKDATSPKYKLFMVPNPV